MTMLKIMVCSLAAMLGFFSAPVVAEGRAYRIELIVFLQAMPNTEVFEQAVSQIQWPSGLTELSSYKQAETTDLDDSYAALAREPGYRPILHVAWVQAAGEGGMSAPVHIQDGDAKLDGYLQVQGEPGLQMTVDLELVADSVDGISMSSASASADAPYRVSVGKTVIYRLNEKRSVKLNELYYLDHPTFGVIAKISSL